MARSRRLSAAADFGVSHGRNRGQADKNSRKQTAGHITNRELRAVRCEQINCIFRRSIRGLSGIAEGRGWNGRWLGVER
jgi:hypothetical protein